MDTANPLLKTRIPSIDILRGAVMLVMAIDHVRDNFLLGSPDPTDLATTTPALFFTRWITHFCAPAFVFLSGISAYLAAGRRTQKQMSSFLIKRGLWLLVVELLVISPGLVANWDYHGFILQVIWAIGGSMIILGVLLGLRVSPRAIGIVGAIIVVGHNVFDFWHVPVIADTVAGKLLISSIGPSPRDFIMMGGNRSMIIVYALLPWTGLMFIGYWCGTLYKTGYDPVRRKRVLIYSGVMALAVFVLFRAFNFYGDPAPWSVQRTTVMTILSFLNVTKYPCSLLYCLMTIGVSLLVLAVAENWNSRFSRVLVVYGNVPFFYYVSHWYLIQVIHVITFFAAGYNTNQIVNPHSIFRFSPDGFGFALPGMYVVWLVVVVLLYLPCRWFSRYKKTHRQWWVSYL